MRSVPRSDALEPFALAGAVLLVGLAVAVTVAWAQAPANRIAVANGDAVVVMRPDGSRRISLDTRPMIGGDVSLSRDGRAAAYASLRGIFLVDVATKSSRRARTPPGVVIDPVFARNSSTLYFLHSRSTTNVRYDLWSVSPSNGRATRHTRDADLQMIDVSPDEQRIAYVRDFSEAGGRIYIAHRDGSRPRFVARGVNPTFSPDGRTLAFTAFDGIRTVSSSGGKSRLVVARGDHAAFSPDGTRLAFVAASRCIDHAYCLERLLTVSVEGGRARAIGPELADPGRLVWR